jgi:hypothetical protein
VGVAETMTTHQVAAGTVHDADREDRPPFDRKPSMESDPTPTPINSRMKSRKKAQNPNLEIVK